MENFEKTKVFIQKAAKAQCDLLVFPELNLTGYVTGKTVCKTAVQSDFYLIKELEFLSLDYRISFLCGFAEKKEGKVFASHGFFSNGKLKGVYRKIQPGPPELSHLTPGNDFPVFDFLGWKFGIQLCFDAHFPEISTIMAKKGAELLIMPHASPRGTPGEKFESWKRHLLARAYDNGVYVIPVNQSGLNKNNLYFPGVSFLVSPSGKVEDVCLEDKESIAYFKADKLKIHEVKSHRMRYFFQYRRGKFYKENL
ncbi:MAG: nitrilase-related carbon-nitrogen hydrolase [Desulforegulaceae bacterium]|nr:nitrilase-related carbon-nitrogen hydrolase [Desulforegulaceae bacterium]